MSPKGMSSSKVIRVSLNWKAGSLNKPQILGQLSKSCVRLETKKLGSKHKLKKEDAEDQKAMQPTHPPHKKTNTQKKKQKNEKKPVSQVKI